MTRNQIALIEAREKERANRANEELTRRGQNIKGATDALRGAGSFLGGLAKPPFFLGGGR